MKRGDISATRLHALLLSAAIVLLTLPAWVAAQESDHAAMHMPAPAKAPAAKTPARTPTAKPAPTSAAAMDRSNRERAMPSTEAEPMDHSAMDHSAMDHSAMDHAAMDRDAPMHADENPKETADHTSKETATDGVTTEKMDHSAMDHSGMDHASMDHATMRHDAPMPGMPRAPSGPVTPIPVLTAADRAAAAPPAAAHARHGESIQSLVLFNRLEAWNADAGTGMAWEGAAWFGGDLNRLWLRSEGERADGLTESADLEVLYGRSVARWWDVVAGVRHDFKPGASQDFLAIGVMGVAPQKFHVEATAYLGQRGQTAARLEAEYELLLTHRLTLQPLVEANLHGKDDARRGIGAGLSTVEVGLRLRYEAIRRFAPYLGIVRERAFGQTADYRRDQGEDIDDTRFVAGFRIWF